LYENGDEYSGKWSKGSKTVGKQIYAEDNLTYGTFIVKNDCGNETNNIFLI